MELICLVSAATLGVQSHEATQREATSKEPIQWCKKEAGFEDGEGSSYQGAVINIAAMPSSLSISELIRKPCMCAGGKCFKQFELEAEGIQKQRLWFQGLDARHKEA